ncbi:MAG TPA: choice-of-anchor B family protein [Vicinamibacterales bacterium]|nr:choice-of-anchor B family protein [Vicinamibacterales bacterium]
MRAVRSVLLLGVSLAVLPAVLMTSTTTTSAFTGFGGAVLVGDGEVFAGEAANQFRPGMVYVYRKITGAWREVATITGPNARVGDRFGSSLAQDGTTLLVGAGAETIHVFTRRDGRWAHASTIEASAVEGDNVRFGAIGAGSDWLLVGQPALGGGRGRGGRGRGSADATPQPAGRVYAFKRDASGPYRYQTTLTSPDPDSQGDNFGASIVMAGTMALIGASGQASRAGVVHEFSVDAAGTWTPTRSFTPTGIGNNALFGSAIALRDSEAVVAAPGDGGYGAAYVFRRVEQGAGRRGGGAGAAGGRGAPAQGAAGTNFTWQEQVRLTAAAAGRQDRFGSAVATTDTDVLIGAPGAGGPGGVFVFTRGATGFRLSTIDLLSPYLPEPAQAGQSLSLGGDVLAVGAAGVTAGAGGLLIYERDADGAWRDTPIITTPLDELPMLTGSERVCSGEGKVEMFECGNTELLAFLPPSALTHDGHSVEMNDLWGWTDPQTGKEWALVGRRDGTTFVDITNPTHPIPTADLPLTEGARPNSWRDMKVYKDHTYIVADSAGPHGMQVFDLTRLRTIQPQANGRPALVTYDVLYDRIASAHNIVINEESGFAYSVGSSGGGETCGGGLHMIDIRNPKQPTFAGCFADQETGRRGTGYSHDAQCVTYRGPDKRYTGHEICVGSNETMISVADVTDKANPKALARAAYPNVGYAHQGWFTDDHRYFFVDDEGDEGENLPRTRTLVWDMTDLENPRLAKEHLGVGASSDHNLYIVGNLMYQANYRSGLRILSITDPENPREVAFFDTAPYTDNGPGFNGAWSVYPFFQSGTIIVNSIEQGLFLVRPTDRPVRR